MTIPAFSRWCPGGASNGSSRGLPCIGTVTLALVWAKRWNDVPADAEARLLSRNDSGHPEVRTLGDRFASARPTARPQSADGQLDGQLSRVRISVLLRIVFLFLIAELAKRFS